jgi:hypothetical protein
MLFIVFLGWKLLVLCGWSYSGLRHWYLVLRGVAVGIAADLELFSAKNININYYVFEEYFLDVERRKGKFLEFFQFYYKI